MDLPILRDFLSSSLRQASNRASQVLARKLASKGITVSEWEVLWALYEEPSRPSDVATELSIDKGAITRLADRLIKKGLLVRRANKKDRRGQILELTAKGSGLAQELLPLTQQAEAELKSRLKAKGYEAMMRLLGQFKDA